QPKMNTEDAYFVKEFILWALVEFKKLSKHRFAEGTQFKDPYGGFMSGL
ncbi:MAG: magnesium chelatase subunit I, partial [Arenicella sp.]